MLLMAIIFGGNCDALATAPDVVIVSTDDRGTASDEPSVLPALDSRLAPTLQRAVAALPDSLQIGAINPRYDARKGREIPLSIYDLPYSFTGTCYDWKRMWINGGVLTGAFVASLIVMETAPEGSTGWSKAEIRKTPWYERWKIHVIDEGPKLDRDKWYFNYLLHPYAGAAYFMAARSCGFNFWQSLFFSSVISNVCWEFGVEATMECPSLQDMLITPLVGSLIGEGFYRLKRIIVDNNYTLFGSKIVGNVVAFLVDPVNEVIGLFAGNPARQVARLKHLEITSSPIINPAAITSPKYGLQLTCIF